MPDIPERSERVQLRMKYPKGSHMGGGKNIPFNFKTKNLIFWWGYMMKFYSLTQLVERGASYELKRHAEIFCIKFGTILYKKLL